MTDSPVARLSEIDQRRWGVRTALASPSSAAEAEAALAFCRSNDVRLLVARCPVDRLDAVHVLQRSGALLMDTLVYYSRDLTRGDPPPRLDIGVRPVRSGESSRVREIATEAFEGYFGHYHADTALRSDECDAVYVEWAETSCVDPNVADEVLLLELEGRIMGFGTMRLLNEDESEGVLFAVAREAQGRGAYRSLIVAGMTWSLEQSRRRMVVSTQITNLAVRKVWARLGFEPQKGYYTLHRWSEEAVEAP